MSFKAYFFDLDGTVYRGSEPTPHAQETLAELRTRGACIRFLTNNSGADPQLVAEKLRGIKIEAEPSEVVTSGMAAARYLTAKAMKRLFVIGEPGLVRILRSNQLVVANADDDEVVRADEDGPYDAVVCGICRSFTYDHLNASLQAIRNGAAFVATNTDATYPVENGREEPGAGALVAALQTCSGVQPHTCGKPKPDMIFMALESCGVEPKEVLVIGDRVDTDIAAADAAGVPSVLVLTGVSKSAAEGVCTIRDLREIIKGE